MRSDSTPALPFFPAVFFRSRQSRQTRLRAAWEALAASELWSLRELVKPWLDCRLLAAPRHGLNSRDRIYNLHVSFFGFLLQVLSGASCADTVKRIQSWMAHLGRPIPSSNNSGYVQARRRLPLDLLRQLFASTVKRLEQGVPDRELWRGRRVKVIDGTGLSMPDTPANQACWPQTRAMQEGCGFPQLKMVALFSLCSGALLGWAEGNKHDGEPTLAHRLWELLDGGDILLGDRGFCSYAAVAALSAGGVDCLFRHHQARRLNWSHGRPLGRRRHDRLMRWVRPAARGAGWTLRQWRQLPEEIWVRVLKLQVGRRGFRSRTIILATTMTDPEQYAAEELAALYGRRWSVELLLRDIKTTLGMDILTGKSPAQIGKEIAMFAIGYNLIRGLVQRAANQSRTPISRISFAAAAAQFREWLWLFMQPRISQRQRHDLTRKFNAAIINAPVPQRPGRVEPRAQKRRPKKYKLLNRPRAQMRRDCCLMGAQEKRLRSPLS